MLQRLKVNIYRFLIRYGFDLKVFFRAIKNGRVQWFDSDFDEIIRQKGTDTTFKIGSKYPILSERNEDGGVMNGHYFHQDLYVARLIYLSKPEKHLDIGSRTDGFVAHVASYREIELIDIRQIKSNVKNIIFRQADLMKLPNDLIEYCDSISSLHVIEHFGLGRYGDPINYWGYLDAIRNIHKILKSNGIFYFSVPIGTQRIEFNAHRVFSINYLMNQLTQYFSIKLFSYIDDKGDFHEDVELDSDNIKTNFNCEFGCGIFVLIKK